MKYHKIDTESLRAIHQVLKPKEGSLIAVKSGSFSAVYGDTIIVTARTHLNCFEGCLPGRIMKNLANYDRDFFYMKVIDDTKIRLKMGSSKHTLYYFPLHDNPIDVDLWNHGLNWLPCPRDIFNGIYLVANVPSREPEIMEQEAFCGIYVGIKEVIAADYNFQRVSRYKLSFPSPFDFALPAKGIKTIFGRLKGKRLLRIALHEYPGAGKVVKGVAFDFGDVRVWVPQLKARQNDTSAAQNQCGGFVKHDANYVISNANKIFNIPCNFLIAIPKAMKTEISSLMGPKDSGVSIIFTRDKMLLRFRGKHISAANEVSVKNHMIKSPIEIWVDKNDFSEALKGKRLMGLLDLRDDNHHVRKILYFKDKKLEHVLRIQ